MDYEAFCLSDPDFYDLPGQGREDADDRYLSMIKRPIPEGWFCLPMNVWTVLQCDAVTLPSQGWKIHVSACLSNAQKILELTWDYCISRGMCFKFLSTPAATLAQNAKYADRGGSGKFLTLYPLDEVALERTLNELGAILKGEAGPYILSDLRWGDGPLYVRYGGFVERHCRNDAGELVAAIEAPGGVLVPDERQPVFRPPSWVELPQCLIPSMERFQATPAGTFPYRVNEAFHHSNAGGVYLGEDVRTGRKVVLKEARPLAGIDANGTDAVSRLGRESRMLRGVQGLSCVPEFVAEITWWEHRFLVEEYIEGETLAHAVATRHPLLTPEPTPERLADYTGWAISVCDSLDAALGDLHRRGTVFGDLHPRNVIVRSGGGVALVDFELASLIDEAYIPGLGAPGFTTPSDRSGCAMDRYALGCMRISMFLPLTEMVYWDPAKLEELIAEIERRFPVPAGFGDRVRRDTGGSPGHDDTGPVVSASSPAAGQTWLAEGSRGWTEVRDSMASAILASATPERQDRLFPGDPAQFTYGGLGLAYGAAGVLWALDECGVSPPRHLVDWLADAARSSLDLAPGLYDGATGIAFALDQLGRRGDALELLDSVANRQGEVDDPTLFGGLAGIGLAFLHFAGLTGSARYLQLAEAVAERAVTALHQRATPPGCGGLMFGWSGLGLFLLRLYERTGDGALLEEATGAVRRDLDGCVWTEEGTLQVDQGWRTLPYLSVGSTGIGVVLHQLAAYRDDIDLRKAQQGIRRAALSELVVQAGLFSGRAGLILYLQALSGGEDRALRPQLENLRWHAVTFHGHVAFVGDHLLRLSMDLATGSAGVLLAVAGVLGGRRVTLPFLAPISSVLDTTEGGDTRWLQFSNSKR